MNKGPVFWLTVYNRINEYLSKTIKIQFIIYPVRLSYVLTMIISLICLKALLGLGLGTYDLGLDGWGLVLDNITETQATENDTLASGVEAR